MLKNAQVDPDRIEEQQLSDLARAHQLGHLRDRRRVQEDVIDQEHALDLVGERHELGGLGDGRRQRLLDQHVLARQERGLRQAMVGRHRRRDGDRVEALVGEHLLEVGAASYAGMLSPDRLQALGVDVAQPRQLGS